MLSLVIVLYRGDVFSLWCGDSSNIKLCGGTRTFIHVPVRPEDLFPHVCRISKQIFRAWKESIAVLCKSIHPVCTVKAGKDSSIGSSSMTNQWKVSDWFLSSHANVFFVCLFSHSTHRTFGKQQWQQLYDRLSSWKQNLVTVKSSLQTLSPTA